MTGNIFGYKKFKANLKKFMIVNIRILQKVQMVINVEDTTCSSLHMGTCSELHVCELW